MVTNYMEIVVEDALENIIREHDLECNCEICLADIKALTLNNLKPMYVASNEGLVYSKLNEFNVQFKADVVFQLMSAIKKVEYKPRH